VGLDGLLDSKPPGQPSKLNDGQRQAVAQMIESGRIPAVHGVVRWRLIDLAQWIFEEFRITIAKVAGKGACLSASNLGCLKGLNANNRLPVTVCDGIYAGQLE
jgi:hypothetical protein